MKKISLENKNIYIIMYHYIQEKKKSLFPKLKFLEFNNFKNQVNYFKSKANILNKDQFYEIIKTKKIPTKPSIILTFDDGYIDHYKYVFPLLNEKKISGFFYPPIKTIEKREVLDVNKIHLILEKEKNKKKVFNLIKYFLKKDFDIEIKDLDLNRIKLGGRYDNKDTMIIKSLLQHHIPFQFRSKIVDKIFSKILQYSEKEIANKIYMNKKHIIEMNENGMSFGSHGYNHYWWEFLKIKEQEIEIKKSVEYFSKLKMFDKKFSVCYPYGSFNSNTIKLLKKYKISFAVTSKPGSLNTKNLKSKFVFPRYDTNDFL